MQFSVVDLLKVGIMGDVWNVQIISFQILSIFVWITVSFIISFHRWWGYLRTFMFFWHFVLFFYSVDVENWTTQPKKQGHRIKLYSMRVRLDTRHKSAIFLISARPSGRTEQTPMPITRRTGPTNTLAWGASAHPKGARKAAFTRVGRGVASRVPMGCAHTQLGMRRPAPHMPTYVWDASWALLVKITE